MAAQWAAIFFSVPTPAGPEDILNEGSWCEGAASGPVSALPKPIDRGDRPTVLKVQGQVGWPCTLLSAPIAPCQLVDPGQQIGARSAPQWIGLSGRACYWAR